MRTFINRNKTVAETLSFVVKEASNNDEKVKILQQLKNRSLKWIVQAMYTRDLSKYPTPKFEYNHRDAGICHGTIHNSINRIESAFRVYDKNPKSYDDLMTLVLQELPREEAELLIDVMAGKKTRGISKTVWKKIYPEFFRTE